MPVFPTLRAPLSVAFALAAAMLLFACARGDSNTTASGIPGGTPGGAQPAACPAALVLPPKTGCDGFALTEPDAIAVQRPGITTTAGPGGAKALRFGDTDDQYIDVKDIGCAQLGKDGTDFSLSMWLKGTGSSQVIGTTDQYGGRAPGFVLLTQSRGDGLLEAQIYARGLPADGPGFSTAQRVATSAPFPAGEWVHVALVYDSNGKGKAATFTLNVNLLKSTGVAPTDVHQPQLRIGDQGYAKPAPFEISELRSYRRALADTEIKALALEKGAAAGLSVAELSTALDLLKAHVANQSPLAPAALDDAVARFVRHAPLLDTDPALAQRALDLVASYEASAGPLFVSAATRNGIARKGTPGDAQHLARSMVVVQQTVLDQVFTATHVNSCPDKLAGKRYLTADYFPGKAPAPADPTRTHTVTISATVPAYWGHPVAFSTAPVVRPTGFYLSPGGIGEVAVPDALVDKGFAVMVGAHTADHANKANLNRLERVSKLYPITAKVTRVANPLGGGVYVVVPYLADAGLVQVTLTGGVIEAPFFSARSFDKTTADQWKQRRTAPAPWADFESDTFMLQVPSLWVDTLDDPAAVMAKWDRAMDGFSEVAGIPPEKRNRTVLYQQVDTQIRHGAFGIGYPQINNTYDPRFPGRYASWLLSDPTQFEVDYHELGHAHFISQFRGETEAIVNFPIVYVLNQKFGVDFDTALARSFGPAYGSKGLTPDDAAIDWMITPEFRSGAEMDHSNTTKDQFRYQQRGYAKYADVARTLGWPAITNFFRQDHLDFMSGAPGDGLSPTDSRILRMSVAAGADLTPLIDFWGIRPENGPALAAKIAALGLRPSPKVLDLLNHYAAILPRINADFLAYYARRYPAACPATAPVDYGCGWFEVWKAKYTATEGAQAQAWLQGLIRRYYP